MNFHHILQLAYPSHCSSDSVASHTVLTSDLRWPWNGDDDLFFPVAWPFVALKVTVLINDNESNYKIGLRGIVLLIIVMKILIMMTIKDDNNDKNGVDDDDKKCYNDDKDSGD